LAVHNALKTACPNMQTLWVGGEGGMEARLVERAGIPFKTIPAAGIHGVAIRQLPGNLSAIVRGTKTAAGILDEFKPDVLFFTGGYVAVPLAIAGRKIPSLLYVPDIEPGMALKALAYFAKCITVTSDESKQYFSKKTNLVVTGYPVRAEMTIWNKSAAREHFEIKSGLPVVLVYGGSKGAHSLNVALLAHLASLLERVELVHISGELDWSEIETARTKLPKELAERYHAFPYLHEDMGAALAAGDLVVSRAGASILGEFPQFGIPAILVPYPYAWRYQKVNADTLTKRGAALMIEDSKLKSGLYLTIEKLLETPEKLEAMRAAMIALRTPDAALKIAAELHKLAGETND
jgi:UDP-N-acetylglucosamine--N-acetylmuramyl-(pentapeptide) pyrophosphoryl-undecaprenol N-acetylglucosamine transferase